MIRSDKFMTAILATRQQAKDAHNVEMAIHNLAAALSIFGKELDAEIREIKAALAELKRDKGA